MKGFEYLLLCLPLISHLLIDATGKVNHKLNGVLMVLVAFAISFFTQGYWWQGFMYALAIHIAFFDHLYNAVHGHPSFYHGLKSNPNRALTDKLWSMTPPHMEVGIKLILLMGGICIYYYFDLIYTWN